MSNATETPAQVTPNAGDTAVTPPVPPTPAADAPKVPPAGTEGKPNAEPTPPAKPTEISLERPDDSPLSEERFASVIEFAKANGYTQEQTEKLVERESVEATSLVEEQNRKVAEAHKQWLEQSKNDPEVGGVNFEKSAELAKRVVQRFGSEELKKALNESGYGDHPELLRFIARIGKAMENDTFERSPGGNPPKKDLASVFYGPESTNPNKE